VAYAEDSGTAKGHVCLPADGQLREITATVRNGAAELEKKNGPEGVRYRVLLCSDYR
jgi:hypothetical protein